MDEIDLKIILNLLANARENFTAIAKECNLSTTTIGSRFSQLVGRGIITGSTILVNHRAMGGKVACSVLVSVDKKEIKQVIDHIKKLPFRIPTIYLDPKNRIGLIAGLHDINELSKLKESIKRSRFVSDVRIDVWTDIKNMPEKLCIGRQQGNLDRGIIQHDAAKKDDYVLDDIDFKLIGVLLQNSMQPFSKLAEQTGVSINTVSRKYKKLVDNGIIRSTIQLDLRKLGYFANVSFALAYSSQIEPEEVIREVLAIKNNYLTIKISGEYDLLVHVLLQDLNQLLLTQKQIAEIPGVSRIEMLVYPSFVPWPGNGEYISTF